MKRTVFLIAALLMSAALFAQEFNGIKIEGSLTNFIAQAKEKGFTLLDKSDLGVTMEGKVGTKPVEIIILQTPKSKQVFKVVVYLPKHTSWYDLKGEYQEYLKLLKGKYGEPSDDFKFFRSPYDEGDGYEMTAVGSDNCVYAAYWTDNQIPNTHLAIEISKYKQVKIGYENKRLTDVRDKEKTEIESNAF